MEKVDNQFYRGYEGEKAIRFFTKKEEIVVWEGFFNDVMEQFRPAKEGWTGIAYYYHLDLGWQEEERWKIPNPEDCLKQFQQLDVTHCRFKESKQVTANICNLLVSAIQKKEDVWIAEE